MKKAEGGMGLDMNGLILYRRFSGTVACESGTLWVSWMGSKDHIVESGESIRVEGARRLVVQALRGEAVAGIAQQGVGEKKRRPATGLLSAERV